MKLLAVALSALAGIAPLRAEPGAIAKVGDRPFQFAGAATDGSKVSLPSLRGKVVMLFFFSTDAGAGLMELRMINKYLLPRFKSTGLASVGIARGEQFGHLAALAKAEHIGFPMLADPQRDIYSHYAAEFLPRVYLIGKDGVIDFVSLGYTDDEVDRVAHAISKELRK